MIRSYCDPLEILRADTGQDSEGADLHAALADSVRHHLIADVPVGLFLSGGIDSSALLSLATEGAEPASLQAVTLGFQEYAGQDQDEVPWACATAQGAGVSHHVLQYGRQDFLSERAKLFAAMDQPTIDGVNTYFVSKATAAVGLKVALSGVGGDEVFGGYPSFRDVPRLVHRLRGFPSGGAKAYAGCSRLFYRVILHPNMQGFWSMAARSVALTCCDGPCTCRGKSPRS